MTNESIKEIPSSESFFSKIYQKTDGVFVKFLLVAGLTGGPIAMFYGYFMMGWGEDEFAGLAIPFTLYFGVAFILTLFRIIYPRMDKTKKSFKVRLADFSEEEFRTKLKRKTILVSILWFILSVFVGISVVLTAISREPIYLVWLIPGIFPIIFLLLEYKQILQIKLEMYNRGIAKK